MKCCFTQDFNVEECLGILQAEGTEWAKSWRWGDRSWQVPCGWSSGGKGGRVEVGMGFWGGTEMTGPYLKLGVG